MARGSSYSWLVSALECLNSSSGPGALGQHGCLALAADVAMAHRQPRSGRGRPPSMTTDFSRYALRAAAIQWLALCWLLMARRT
jgi:hypothetical protein